MGQTENEIIMLAGKLLFRSFLQKEVCHSRSVSRKQDYAKMGKLKKFNKGTVFVKNGQVKVNDKEGCSTQRLAMIESHYCSYM